MKLCGWKERESRGYGIRLADKDGTLAAKVRNAFLRLPCDERVRARRALRERVGEFGASRWSVEWWLAGYGR